MSSRKPASTDAGFDSAGAQIHDKPFADELKDSYLEYAYAVIYSRAVPDVRDGLKPVHRRILYTMREMGLRPDAAQVKSARVVGSCLGKYHPHGDSSVYEALVRLAQDFSVNAVLVDGHGNFGSINDGPAAMRYTECRLAPAAMLMVGELNEGTVNMVPNYDGSLDEPSVLPSAFPGLLVNGTSGIAVGMATNMIPHNLGETVAAARALLKNPAITLDALMRHLPGPDLPTGGLLLGADQVRAAYETGRGTVRIRAKAEVAPLEGSRGRSQIVFTELPYQVGTEKVIESIKTEMGKKRLSGIADVKDLSDRRHGLRLVVEAKTGVNAQALLAELYRHTPLETSFGINNLALVDGQPKTLGLKELLEEWVAFRLATVTRRTEHRLARAEERKHIVDGLLIALDAVDQVVKTIRSSKDTAEAKAALLKRFPLSEVQAVHILEMPLRRLVSLEVDALRKEAAELADAIAGFRRILDDETALRKLVDGELAEVSRTFAQPRRTLLVDGELKEILAASAPAGPVEVADEPTTVMLTATGLLCRTPAASEEAAEQRARRTRSRHDVFLSDAAATTRGQFLAVTSHGRGLKADVLSVPALPRSPGLASGSGGAPVKELIPLMPGERVVALAPLPDQPDGILLLGTKTGGVKACNPADWPQRSDEFDVISLKPGDEVIGGAWAGQDGLDVVFVTSDANLLRFPASTVRPQGRSGGGMGGVRLAAGATVVAFNVAGPDALVLTHTGSSAKLSPLSVFPAKGRATGGVRAHKFLRGEDSLAAAWVGASPAGCAANGAPVQTPTSLAKRDASGTPAAPVHHTGTTREN